MELRNFLFSFIFLFLLGCTPIEMPQVTCVVPEPKNDSIIVLNENKIDIELKGGKGIVHLLSDDGLYLDVTNCGEPTYGRVVADKIKEVLSDNPDLELNDLIIRTTAYEDIGGCKDLVNYLNFNRVIFFEPVVSNVYYESLLEWIPLEKIRFE